jgi:hypothetical protein
VGHGELVAQAQQQDGGAGRHGPGEDGPGAGDAAAQYGIGLSSSSACSSRWSARQLTSGCVRWMNRAPGAGGWWKSMRSVPSRAFPGQALTQGGGGRLPACSFQWAAEYLGRRLQWRAKAGGGAADEALATSSSPPSTASVFCHSGRTSSGFRAALGEQGAVLDAFSRADCQAVSISSSGCRNRAVRCGTSTGGRRPCAAARRRPGPG